MGLLTRAIVWRWLARWLMRGSPWAVVAKLATVGAIGAWRYNRKRKTEGQDRRRIEAEYEVLGPERIAPVARPPQELQARSEGTGFREVDEGPTSSR
ncbi:MAG TPA: hypothetical protein VEY33_07545 [Gemmatimonadota bacterium]|nr:hypothetical protein [Gemmatimonadota bacterium]